MINVISLKTATLEPDFFGTVKSIMARCLYERSGVVMSEDVSKGADSMVLRLEYDKALHSDGYRISENSGQFLIESDSKSGVLSGLGRFLRDGILSTEGFTQGSFRGEEFPAKPFRGIYFASHFYNFYHSAPLDKIHRLQEDLALWGQNIQTLWYDMHHYSAIDDPESLEFAARMKAIMKHANTLGVKTVYLGLANEAFNSSPKELRAEWAIQNGYVRHPHSHYELELCPSKPGGMEKIIEYRLQTLKLYKEVEPDYFTFWPYDQGGCTCEGCAPWGGVGFLKCVKTLIPLIKEIWPKTRIILSGWFFERFYPGEWDRFFEETTKDGFPYTDFADYFMAYFPDNIFGETFNVPKQITEGQLPAGLPLIDFPEISMQGAFPWGGFGANPQPKWLQSIENKTGQLYKGGYAYSEGIFEDINKAIILSLYSGRHTCAVEAIREYTRYEFSAELANEITEILCLMEETLPHWREDTNSPEAPAPCRFILGNTQHVDEVYNRTMAVDAKLDEKTRTGWRWRLVYLRAKIDYQLTHNNFYNTPASDMCFRELAKLYHVTDKSFYAVTPPASETLYKERGKEM